MEILYHRTYFFDAGIRFMCQRCGDCCTGEPGIVSVTPDEITRIAEHLEMTVETLTETLLLVFEDGHRIQEEADGRCVFFDGGCRIYPVRPQQCRTFPFWIDNLRSESQWEAVCHACRGIGNGRLYTKREILDILADEE